MAKSITITNGTGSVNLNNGTYSVTSNVGGYDNSSISPASLTVSEDVNSYNFTIGATGTLTLHVTEEGISSGTSIVGATFNRTDADSNVYGSVITTDDSGNAVFNNVPYATTGSLTVYYKQISTTESHTFDSTVQAVTLTASADTLEISNPLAAERTFNLTDANYTNLPIESGTINLS